MALSRFRLRRTAFAFLAGAATVLFSVGGTPSAADGNGRYLALGDSVVFGFIAHDSPAYANADNFVGYPEHVRMDIHLNVTNASCPGEATGGFLSAIGADNGCRPYKGSFPLHTSYAGTQAAFATAYLTSHPGTNLVTIGIGANDLFLLQSSCGGNALCIQAGLPATLATIGSNLDTIYAAIRATGFHGVLMAVNYYSLDYTDAANTAITQLLNADIAAHTAAAHGVVADVFSAFQTAAGVAGGHTCFAGLLNGSGSNPLTCDVHPSQTGQSLMARTVEATYLALTGDEQN